MSQKKIISKYFRLDLLSLLLGFLFPTTHEGIQITTIWHDQSLFHDSLQQLLQNGKSQQSHLGNVGPGYLAIGHFIAHSLGTDASSTLVIMNRILVAFSCMLITRLILKFLGLSSEFTLFDFNLHKHRFQFLVSVILSLTGFFWLQFNRYSDLPWTTFACIFFILLTLDSLFKLDGFAISHTNWMVVGFATLWCRQIRQTEGYLLVGVVALFLVFELAKEHRKNGGSFKKQLLVSTFKRIAYILSGSFFAWIIIGILSHDFTIFHQYWNAKQGEPLVLTPDLTSTGTKLWQLFVNPCYQSVCPANSYLPLVRGVYNNRWRSPVLLQIWILGPAICTLVFQFIKKWRSKKSLEYLLALCLTVLSLSYIILVSDLPVINPAVLKFGISREFIAPTILLLVSLGLLNKIEKEKKWNAFNVLASLTVLVCISAYFTTIPSLGGKGFVSLRTEMLSSCKTSNPCRVNLSGIDTSNAAHRIDPKGWIRGYDSKGNLGIFYTIKSDGVIPSPLRDQIINGQVSDVVLIPWTLGIFQTPTYSDFQNQLTTPVS